MHLTPVALLWAVLAALPCFIAALTQVISKDGDGEKVTVANAQPPGGSADAKPAEHQDKTEQKADDSTEEKTEKTERPILRG